MPIPRAEAETVAPEQPNSDRDILLFLKVFGFKDEELSYDEEPTFRNVLGFVDFCGGKVTTFMNDFPDNDAAIAGNDALILEIGNLRYYLTHFLKNDNYLQFVNAVNGPQQGKIASYNQAINFFKRAVTDKFLRYQQQIDSHWKKIYDLQTDVKKQQMSDAFGDSKKETADTTASDQETYGNFADILTKTPQEILNDVVTGTIDRTDRAQDRDAAFQERFKRMKELAKDDENIRRMLPIVENIYTMWVFTIKEKGLTINIDNLTVQWDSLSGKLESSSKGLSFYDNMRTSNFYINGINPLTKRMFLQMCAIVGNGEFKGSNAWNNGEACVAFCHEKLLSESPEYKQYLESFGDKRAEAEALLKESAAYDASFRDLRARAAMWLLGMDKSAFKHKHGDAALPVGIALNASYQVKNYDLGQYATLWGMGLDINSDPVRSLATSGYYIEKGTKTKVEPGIILDPSKHELFVPFAGSKTVQREIEGLNAKITEEKHERGETKKYHRLVKKVGKLQARLVEVKKEEAKSKYAARGFGKEYPLIDQNKEYKQRKADIAVFERSFKEDCLKGSKYARVSKDTKAYYLRIAVLYPESIQNYLEYMFGYGVEFQDQKVSLSDLYVVPPIDDFFKAPMMFDIATQKIADAYKKESDPTKKAQLKVKLKRKISGISDNKEIPLQRAEDNNMANYLKARSSVEWLFNTATSAMAQKIDIPHNDKHLAETKFRDLFKGFGTQLAMAMGYPWDKPYDYKGAIDGYKISIEVLSEKLAQPDITPENKQKYQEEKEKFESLLNEASKMDFGKKAELKQKDMSNFFKQMTRIYMASIFVNLPWDKGAWINNDLGALFSHRVREYREIVHIMKEAAEEYVQGNSSLKAYGLKFGFLDMLDEESLEMFKRQAHMFETDAKIRYWADNERIRQRSTVNSDDEDKANGVLRGLSNYIKTQVEGSREEDKDPKYPFRHETKEDAKK